MKKENKAVISFPETFSSSLGAAGVESGEESWFAGYYSPDMSLEMERVATLIRKLPGSELTLIFLNDSLSKISHIYPVLYKG